MQEWREMQVLSKVMVPVILVAAAWCPLGAQSLAATRADEKRLVIPKAFLPPPGMCRVWIENIPAERQSPPTDCATAIRTRPFNGRVIFGDSAATAAKRDSTAKPRAKKP